MVCMQRAHVRQSQQLKPTQKRMEHGPLLTQGASKGHPLRKNKVLGNAFIMQDAPMATSVQWLEDLKRQDPSTTSDVDKALKRLEAS